MIRANEQSLVLDFGGGAFANFLQYHSVSELGAIAISHLHADHVIDLIPLRYALRYGTVRRESPLPVYVPPGACEVLERFASTLSGEQNAFFDGVIDLREYDIGVVIDIAGFQLSFARTQHYIEAYALSVLYNGLKIVYSGDTARDERIVEHASTADIFICEATLGAHGVERGKRGHCSAREAGAMAQAARVRRLALTHYGIEHDPMPLRLAAATEYSGPIDVLDDHMKITVYPARIVDHSDQIADVA